MFQKMSSNKQLSYVLCMHKRKPSKEIFVIRDSFFKIIGEEEEVVRTASTIFHVSSIPHSFDSLNKK